MAKQSTASTCPTDPLADVPESEREGVRQINRELAALRQAGGRVQHLRAPRSDRQRAQLGPLVSHLLGRVPCIRPRPCADVCLARVPHHRKEH